MKKLILIMMMACFIIGCSSSKKNTSATNTYDEIKNTSNLNPPDWMHGTWDMYTITNTKSDGYFIFTESEITQYDPYNGTENFSTLGVTEDYSTDTSYSLNMSLIDTSYTFKLDENTPNTILFILNMGGAEIETSLKKQIISPSWIQGKWKDTPVTGYYEFTKTSLKHYNISDDKLTEHNLHLFNITETEDTYSLEYPGHTLIFTKQDDNNKLSFKFIKNNEESTFTLEKEN